ncbi:MAG: hypothetical protein HY897_02610 [Deltaproteobacteria bacterium]|nr:hypothetical protein [Deltaproteobacteria bacterium]
MAQTGSENRLLLYVAPYSALLRAAYAPKVEVSERTSDNNTLLVSWGAIQATKDKAKDLRQVATSLSTRPNEDTTTGDVCLMDGDGTEVARFSPAQSQLKQFESYLSGIDKIHASVFLDVKKAGLGPQGTVEVMLPEEDVKRLHKLVTTTPNATFVAKHEKKSDFERTAFVALPVENDGHLRVKVQLSQALALKPTDKLLIKGPGFDLYGLLLAFPDVDKLLEALVTSYGVMKEVRFPASAFSVIREPGKVVFGPGRYYVTLVAEDSDGRVIALKTDKLNVGLVAERPLSGRCGLVLRPDPGVLTTYTKFEKLEAWEIKKVSNVRLVDRDLFDVQVKFDVPAPCGPAK